MCRAVEPRDELPTLFHATGTRTAADISDEERQRGIHEWDESRERERLERERVSEMWRRRRERWAKHRGDTGPASRPIPPKETP